MPCCSWLNDHNPTLSFMRTTDSILWKTLKFFQLHRAYRSVKRWIPSSIVNIISNITIKNAHMPMVSVEDLEPQYEMAWKHLQGLGVELGDYLEFGVSYGMSMSCMHRVLTRLKLKNVRMIGFDSFKGLPESAATEHPGIWKPGQFATPNSR